LIYSEVVGGKLGKVHKQF